MTQFEYPV